MGRLFGVGALLCTLVVLLAPGAALAHVKPEYQAKGDTRVTEQTGWLLSAKGSLSWGVTETGSDSSGDSWSYDESSRANWDYGVAGESSGASGLIVDYPTLCRVSRSYPCPQPMGTGVGRGPSNLVFSINDTISDGNAPPQTVKCTGSAKSDGAGGVGVTATYLKDSDSYELTLSVVALPASLVGGAAGDPECPGPNVEGVGVLGVWAPPLLPPGGPLLTNWWSGGKVRIPARQFATSREIEIPVTLDPKNGAPQNCGLAQDSGEDCTAVGHWSGTVVLHRAPGN